jgi:hypothetical protein
VIKRGSFLVELHHSIFLSSEDLLSQAVSHAAQSNKMGALGQLVPLVLLFAFVAVFSYIGYQVCLPFFLHVLFEALKEAQIALRNSLSEDKR